MSHSNQRRRRWRTVATTLALTLGSLAVPAAALADGQLDPAFNGTGYHVGTVAEGTVFNNVDTRIPMVVQANGSVVIGGSRGGFMTLARYTAAGALDTTFGVNGFATQQFAGTPGSSPGNSGATAMTLDAAGNIIVAGFGASQSMVVARFTANGAFSAAAVCYAPHLIDYTARAVALRGTAIVLVGYARDRHPSIAVPGTPAVMYGQRAVVTLPAVAASAPRRAAPTRTTAVSRSAPPASRSTASATTAPSRPTSSRRPAATTRASRRSPTAATSSPRPPAPTAPPWVQRFTAAGVGALDTTFNALGAVPGRVPVARRATCTRSSSRPTAPPTPQASRSTRASRPTARCSSRASTRTGALGDFGAGGIARARVAGGNNTGQALVFQGANVIVGGSANLAGKAAFGLVRFNAANGARDDTFGANGQVATPIGTPPSTATSPAWP